MPYQSGIGWGSQMGAGGGLNYAGGVLGGMNHYTGGWSPTGQYIDPNMINMYYIQHAGQSPGTPMQTNQLGQTTGGGDWGMNPNAPKVPPNYALTPQGRESYKVAPPGWQGPTIAGPGGIRMAKVGDLFPEFNLNQMWQQQQQMQQQMQQPSQNTAQITALQQQQQQQAQQLQDYLGRLQAFQSMLNAMNAQPPGPALSTQLPGQIGPGWGFFSGGGK